MTKVTYSVPNISCMHCVHTIQTELADVKGVQSAKADAATKQVEIVFDINLQFLIQGMGILDLMMHACSCPVVLHPGLLFQQGTVIQRICSVVAISDGYFHGRICHGDIFFELDAILSEVVIIVI